MIKKTNKNKGATSMIWVIAIFISAIIISGFVNITNKTLVINEVQGIMDMSGLIALRYAVDDANLRSEERLHVDTGIAKHKFTEIIDSNLSGYVGPNRMFNNYNIESVSILKDVDTAVGALQGKDEYFLEAVITVEYDVVGLIDGATMHAVNYFDFLWSGANASVTVADTRRDGVGNVIIRTVSRLALR